MEGSSSHTCTVPSAKPEIIREPAAANATEKTASSGPANRAVIEPERISQTYNIPSLEPVTITRPLGESFTCSRADLWSNRRKGVEKERPSSAHILAVQSSDPVA